MNFLINLLPIFIFFIFYHLYGMFIASALLIFFSGFTCGINWFFYKTLDKICFFNFLSTLIFGLLTILFHNSNFIKWKLTIIYFFLFILLCFYHKFQKKTLIQTILEKKISLSNVIWKKLNILWSSFFLLCSILNAYIVIYFSEITWINFKVFGLTSLTLIFIILNSIYIKYLISREK